MLQDKAMLIRASWSRPTGRKTDRTASMTVEQASGAQAGRYNATKRLWAGSTYDKIKSLDTETENFIKFYTRPWLDSGWRILPTAAYFDVVDGINERKEKRENLVREFNENLDQIIANERAALGTAFNEADYDMSATKEFGFDVFFMPIPAQGDFDKLLSGGIEAEDVAKIEADFVARNQKALNNTDVWERVHDAVAKMAERLHAYGKDANGKVVNKFWDSLIENMRELTAVLPKLNITGDPNLAAMHKVLEQELCYFDAQILRDNDLVREDVATKADKILAEVAAFIA